LPLLCPKQISSFRDGSTSSPKTETGFPRAPERRLLFHHQRGSHARVFNRNRPELRVTNPMHNKDLLRRLSALSSVKPTSLSMNSSSCFNAGCPPPVNYRDRQDRSLAGDSAAE
jgi:hypothetical protein